MSIGLLECFIDCFWSEYPDLRKGTFPQIYIILLCAGGCKVEFLLTKWLNRKYFSKPIDKPGNRVYYQTIESEQATERSGMQCLKSTLMLQICVVECVSPGHIRMAGCIRIHFAAPEYDVL